jgi:alpha-1,6-mannosyltransferase
LVEAVERLGPRYRLLAMGAGPQPPHGAQVHLLDFVSQPSEMARAMASVDAFVHAGDQETGGLAVLEAVACGTPMAVRDAGGLSELVADGCGIAVPTNGADDWAQAIEALFASDRSRIIGAALVRARRHDWSHVLATLQRRYADAMRGRPRAELP